MVCEIAVKASLIGVEVCLSEEGLKEKRKVYEENIYILVQRFDGESIGICEVRQEFGRSNQWSEFGVEEPLFMLLKGCNPRLNFFILR